MIEGAAVLSGSGTLTVAAIAEYGGKASLSGEGTITARGLVPFTREMMSQVVIEMDDREIYNDIRSETEVTEESVKKTADDEYREVTVSTGTVLNAGASEEIILRTDVTYPYIPSTDEKYKSTPSDVTWTKQWVSSFPVNINGITESECYALGGKNWYPPAGSELSSCLFDYNTSKVTISVVRRASWYTILKVTNTDVLRSQITIYATYRYLFSPAEYTTVRGQAVYTIRATDASSIAKYGRRVMNLVWPLGQTETQMTDLLDAYLLRFKEPMPQIKAKLLGINDTMVNKILHTHISDKIWVDDTTIGVADYFFVNSINCNHHVSGMLEADWDLEQMRVYERGPLFTLDTSILDGPHVLGW